MRPASILPLLIGFLINAAVAEETIFSVKPKRCVSMHKGQTCYQKLKFSWSVKILDDYCLFSSEQETPIKCWEQENSGKFQYEFVSDNNIVYQLRREGSEKILGQQEIKVESVYRRGKKSHSGWRLF